MTVLGSSIIAGHPVVGTAGTFRSYDPALGITIEPDFTQVDAAVVNTAALEAQKAFNTYRNVAPETRAKFLESIAHRIEQIRAEIIDRATAETGLSSARIDGEVDRTANQLRLFAYELRLGEHQGVRIQHSDPDRKPAPRPDIRLRMIPLGPVAVFGASNFPLAFSVAGGDTASALAAGCPVIVKAHSSHAGTAELVGQQITEAVRELGLPAGTFSLIFGAGPVVGQALAAHPAIKAIAFTGSQAGGVALMRTAAERPEPIPVYAEMSSINPVIWLPGAVESDVSNRIQAFVASLTLGSGQFCTNPGLLFIPANQVQLVESIEEVLRDTNGQTMLSEGIRVSFESGVDRLKSQGLEVIAVGQPGPNPNAPAPTVFRISAADYLKNHDLQEEVFGAAAIVVTYSSLDELLECASGLQGQLTATIHFTDADKAEVLKLLPVLETRVGRVIANGWPTGVEVSHAMVHGGPFPATSDIRTTSVGSLAIERFQRPVCYQGFNDDLLPPALQESNPLSVPRRVDGILHVS